MLLWFFPLVVPITATTAAYVFSTLPHVVVIASPILESTKSLSGFSMFFNLSPTSRLSSFSETLASARPLMELSRSLFSTQVLHSSIAFIPNSFIPFIAAGERAVHPVVRCMWVLHDTPK